MTGVLKAAFSADAGCAAASGPESPIDEANPKTRRITKTASLVICIKSNCRCAQTFGCLRDCTA